jgi:hypothetical protein
MGTITAQTIINRVTAALLNDAGKVRFLEAHLLGFLNEGQRVIASLAPQSYSAPTSIVCVAGVVQTLPATAHTMLRPRHNVVAGNPGRAITATREEVVNTVDPNWRAATAEATVKHVIYDPTVDRKTFLVYPPATAGATISLILGLIPTDILIGAVILLDDTFEAPLSNYIMARAYEKDAEYSGNAERTSYYMNLMMTQLGLTGQSAAASTVNK